MEDRILYIHGFNGSPNGTTGSFIKNFFKDAIVIAPKLDLLDYDNTVSKLKDIIKDNNLNIIVTHYKLSNKLQLLLNDNLLIAYTAAAIS